MPKVVSILFDKVLGTIMEEKTEKFAAEEDVVEEDAADNELSAKSAWTFIMVALLIRTLLAFFVVPFMWNIGFKPAFGLKNEIDGRVAVALVFLIDFLM